MNDMSLKAKIKHIAKEKNISAQAVLQNYLMSRFLYRLSLSEYKDKFVLKGGMLIASIIGIDHRVTMDLDTTLKGLPLDESSIKTAFEAICGVNTDDGIEYKYDSITPIRDDDEYGGYRVSFHADYGKIKAPMSMDVSTGDVITPGARQNTFKDLLNENVLFKLWSYTIETVLAEKIETILSRGIDNTRPRDFYDVYMLSGFDCNADVFKEAFRATATHRGSFEKISDFNSIVEKIGASTEMNQRWNEYSRRMPYANGIKFEDTLVVMNEMLAHSAM